MRKTLNRITHKGSRTLNQYSLQPNSHIVVNLPNGDDLRLYASEDGKYVNITVSSHRKETGCMEIKSDNRDFDDFTTQRESIAASYGNSEYTVMKYTAFHKKGA